MDVLSELAEQYKTDKGIWWHSYTPVYHKYFRRYKDADFSLLELGVGGGDDITKGGSSLLMWRDYFTKANIIGIDTYEKPFLFKEERIKTFVCSQNDEVKISNIITEYNPIIVIDDASHISWLTIRSFEIIFPLLQPGAIYVCEDLESSYWKDGEWSQGGSAMDYFKKLCDSIILDNTFSIESIHFYNKIVFIFKG